MHLVLAVLNRHACKETRSKWSETKRRGGWVGRINRHDLRRRRTRSSDIRQGAVQARATSSNLSMCAVISSVDACRRPNDTERGTSLLLQVCKFFLVHLRLLLELVSLLKLRN